MASVSKDGLQNKSNKVANETAKLIPGIYMPYLQETEILPNIQNLHAELNNKERSTQFFGALLRVQEVLGAAAFEGWKKQLHSKERNLFRSMTMNNEDKDYHTTKKRPNDGVSFGMITNTTINRAMDRTNRHERSEGAELIKAELENGKEDLGLLLPYMGSFIKFLGGLLVDRNPKVILTTLECHEILIEGAPETIKSHAELITFNLLKISLDSKPQVKTYLYVVMKKLMMCCSPQIICEHLILEINHKNPKMREDIIIYIIYALLTFPSTDFKLDFLCERVCPFILDPKRRVRQGSIECTALLATALGEKKKKLLDQALTTVEKEAKDPPEGLKMAINARIGRKVLPRLNDEGYIDYGLIIPHDYYSRNVYASNGQKQKLSTVFGGPDVEWILKATGSLSKGTSNYLTNQLLVTSNNAMFGSNTSLRSLKNEESNNGGGGGGDHSDGGYDSPPHSAGSLNRHAIVPDIPRSGDEEEFENTAPSGFEEGDNGIIESIDDENMIKEQWKNSERELTEKEKKEREATYSAKTKSQSIVDLKKAAKSKKGGKDAKKKDKKKKKEDTELKQSSLTMLGMGGSTFKTLFDEEEGASDDEIPGAFNNPEKAFNMAKKDMNSKQWQTEVDGMEAIVRLIKYHAEFLTPHAEDLVVDLMHECRNLRSQVARAAIQTLTLMFVYLGRGMEVKGIEHAIELLLTKSADTNRFIRSDANDALLAMAENISVFEAAKNLVKVGLEHKNTVARTATARTLSDIAEKLGGEKLMVEGEADVRAVFFKAGAKLIADGSMDTRTEIKRMFGLVISNDKFQEALEKAVTDKGDLSNAEKPLKLLKEEKEAEGGEGAPAEE